MIDGMQSLTPGDNRLQGDGFKAVYDLLTQGYAGKSGEFIANTYQNEIPRLQREGYKPEAIAGILTHWYLINALGNQGFRLEDSSFDDKREKDITIFSTSLHNQWGKKNENIEVDQHIDVNGRRDIVVNLLTQEPERVIRCVEDLNLPANVFYVIKKDEGTQVISPTPDPLEASASLEIPWQHTMKPGSLVRVFNEHGMYNDLVFLRKINSPAEKYVFVNADNCETVIYGRETFDEMVNREVALLHSTSPQNTEEYRRQIRHDQTQAAFHRQRMYTRNVQRRELP